MTTSTAVATYDAAFLAQLEGMAVATDVSASTGPDLLKINYDADSIHERGKWVLGQKKNKESAITEEGVLIDKIVILTTRCRHSYYHEATKEYINTQIYENGQQPPDKAEAMARVAALGGELKFQTVLYGVALTPDGMKDFTAYISGSAYMAMKAHLQDLSVVITPARKIVVPLFSHITLLGPSEKKKNGAVTYYIPSFLKGPAITWSPDPEKDQVGFFSAKRDEVYDYITRENARANEKKVVSAPVATPSSGEYIPPAPPAYAPPVGEMKSANPKPMEDDVPFEMPVDDGGYDIEAAMKAVIDKK